MQCQTKLHGCRIKERITIYITKSVCVCGTQSTACKQFTLQKPNQSIIAVQLDLLLFAEPSSISKLTLLPTLMAPPIFVLIAVYFLFNTVNPSVFYGNIHCCLGWQVLVYSPYQRQQLQPSVYFDILSVSLSSKHSVSAVSNQQQKHREVRVMLPYCQMKTSSFQCTCSAG